MGPCGRRQSPIGSQIAGVAIKVLSRAELERVHVDAHHHQRLGAPTGLAGPANQLAMALVQGAHGGHVVHRPLLASSPGTQLGQRVQMLHQQLHQKNPSCQIGGWGFIQAEGTVEATEGAGAQRSTSSFTLARPLERTPSSLAAP
jgi:hypothetical protein